MEFNAANIQEIIRSAIAANARANNWPTEQAEAAIREVNKHVPFVFEAVAK
ncbi:hypothetical protein LGM35_06445 [Burkholderia cenocepacia]|uniref:hypothetical protein n=1 Tax=Burkholderia cenocepacia TaxID=95486 RepID=UPI001CF1FA3C|nr:hypothetical protein [Burkholderia cenocepacia]MCA7922120.1 hypothetical protein [Burkholderia cenocepacia]